MRFEEYEGPIFEYKDNMILIVNNEEYEKGNLPPHDLLTISGPVRIKKGVHTFYEVRGVVRISPDKGETIKVSASAAWELALENVLIEKFRGNGNQIHNAIPGIRFDITARHQTEVVKD